MRKLKVAIILSLIFISLSNVVLSNAISFEGKIHKNVYLRDMDLSGMTKEEASNKINNMLDEKKEFLLKVSEKEYVFKKEYIDVDYKVDDLVEQAYSIGRKEGIIYNLKVKTNLNLGEKETLDYNCSFNEKKLNDYINCLDKEVYKKPINATLSIKNGNINVTKDEIGFKINQDKLKSLIISKIKDINCDDEFIPTISITPEYSYKELIKIDTVLGEFETYFNTNNKNRSNNIRVAADATSNTILKEGEIFSFNNSIEKPDISKNFKEATVIINGKKENGIGGGMCQVSSTIYNAALYSGMKIINSTNHSIPSGYIEKGRDATVAQNFIDFKFSNQYETPVFIYNQVHGNRIISKIYGNKEDKKNIQVVTEVTDIIPNRTIRKNSDELKLGEKVVNQEGRKGYKVKTYRIYKGRDKKTTEFIRESYYPPQEKIIIYGTIEESK